MYLKIERAGLLAGSGYCLGDCDEWSSPPIWRSIERLTYRS